MQVKMEKREVKLGGYADLALNGEILTKEQALTVLEVDDEELLNILQASYH